MSNLSQDIAEILHQYDNGDFDQTDYEAEQGTGADLAVNLDGAVTALTQLFEKRLVEEKAAKVEASKSFCGCLMCEFHRRAYELKEAA